MRWFDRWWSRRSAPRWRLSELTSWSDLGGPWPSAAGVIVTPERALCVPAVYACHAVLSQDVAKTPIKLRRRVGDDTYSDATDHALWEVLHALSNPETSAYTLKQDLMLDLLAHERAYAEIIRVEGQVQALWRLDPTRMVVDRDDQRRKRYRYTTEQGTTTEWRFDASRPPIFELRHPSPLRHCRDLVGTALALQAYVGRFFANGAHLGGVLQTDDDLDADQVKDLRAQFETETAGTRNAWRPYVLSGGLKWQAVAAPNDQAQLNETLQTIRTEFAAAYRLPAWKVGDLSKATYSNMEAGSIEYVSGTLDPYFTCWEQAIRRDLLTSRQYGQYDVIFDRGALIRSDVKSLHEAMARGRDAGFYSVNDVRKKLGENPIPAGQGGDLYAANANLRPLTASADQGSQTP